MARKTHEEYVQEVYNRWQDEFEVIGTFTKTKNSIWIKHKCGYEFEIIAEYVTAKDRKYPPCKKCEHKRKNPINLSYIAKYVEAFNYELEKKQIYHPNKPLNFKCDKGHIFISRFYFIHKEGKRCSQCEREKYCISRHQEMLKELSNDDYVYLQGEYLTEDSRYEIECSNGHRYNASWATFVYSKARCMQCYHDTASEKQRMSYNRVLQIINARGYSFTGEYVNQSTPVDITCPKGHLWSVTLNNFHSKKRECPICTEHISQGEIKVASVLTSNNICHKREYQFQDLVSPKINKVSGTRNRLRFDFGVMQDDNIVCLIEYDGIQHFEPVDFNGEGEDKAQEKFKATQLRDYIKNKYCEDNNIPLLRIPYWEFDNIESIISEYLSQFNLITLKIKEVAICQM